MHGRLQRHVLPILLAAAGLACISAREATPAAADAAPPDVKKLEASVEVFAASVRVISRWSAVPPGQAIDSINVATSMGAFPVQGHTKPPTATADTALFDITLFTPGVAVGGQVSTQTIRRGIRSTAVSVPINFTRPDAPPPALAGLTVAVDSV